MSCHENTIELINGVCMLEYSHARENWGKTYHSLHEGWAVLKEEVEEAFDSVTDMWYNIRNCDKDIVLRLASSMQETAINAMMELAQIWSVCEKMKCCGNCKLRGAECVALEYQGILCGKTRDKWELAE